MNSGIMMSYNQELMFYVLGSIFLLVCGALIVINSIISKPGVERNTMPSGTDAPPEKPN